jgi:hypothetical protein
MITSKIASRNARSLLNWADTHFRRLLFGRRDDRI